MFEKQAEEYQTEKRKTFNEYEQLCWGDVYKDWKNGAEFGYNKANEWHYVKDGDLPKGNGLFIFYWKLGSIDDYMVFKGTINNIHKDVVAWKEIVLPELPKESE